MYICNTVYDYSNTKVMLNIKLNLKSKTIFSMYYLFFKLHSYKCPPLCTNIYHKHVDYNIKFGDSLQLHVRMYVCTSRCCIVKCYIHTLDKKLLLYEEN